MKTRKTDDAHSRQAVGHFITKILRRPGVSGAGLARAANIDPRTLRRWRYGEVEPHLVAWRRLLDALALPERDRLAALGLLSRAQAVVHLRDRPHEQARDVAPGSVSRLPFDVAPGDLLRAMRERQTTRLGRRLTGEEVARRLGVSPGKVSRWERTERQPPPEHLDALMILYGAHDQERQALHGGWLLTGPPVSTASMEACEHELELLTDQVDAGGFLLGDLTFRVLEWRLGQLVAAGGPGGGLLVRAWEWHAEWLQRTGRWAESQPYIRQVLRTAVPARCGHGSWDRAVIQAAQYAAQGAPRASPKRGLDVLEHWRGHAAAPCQWSAMLRDMAQFFASRRREDEADACIKEAIKEAERDGDPSARAGARFVRARCMLDTGRPEQALNLINAEPESACAGARVQQERVRIRALLALNDPEAEARLAMLYDLLDRFGYEHLRPEVDALARLA